MKHFALWKEASHDFWYNKIWLSEENMRFREHEEDELSHYSKATIDVEYQYPRWRWELQWLAYRTDFDLKQHQEYSGKDLSYHDPHTGKRYLPHVIEPAFWLSRTVCAAMIDAYEEEQYTDWNDKEQTRVVARFHKNIAPIKFAILPLIKKDEKQVQIARAVFSKLSDDYMCEYDDGWAIGKRYRRQDEIGTPFCITVDHQTVEDGTVTIRERDTMEQKRINTADISL
jgi:glycyl-tRNA synthetase